MPTDPCLPCECDPAPLGHDPLSYRYTVLRILCQVLAAIEGGGGGGSCSCVVDGQVVAGPTTGNLAAGTDGANYQFLSVTAAGILNTLVTNGAGASAVNIQDGGNSITVDGTVTANAGTGFPPVVTDGAAAGTTGIHVLGTDGVNAQILSTDTAGVLNVNVASSTPTLTEVDPIFSDYPFGSITNAYTLALTNTVTGKVLDLLNQTDASLLISFDGVTDHLLVPAGIAKLYDLAGNTLKLTGDVYVKYSSGAPTLGSLVTTILG